MLVRRTTMEAAIAAERARWDDERSRFYAQYGKALFQVAALQKEMSAWVMNEAENITPEQAAQMFYAQDDSWQAAFFNVMQAQVLAHHAAQSDVPGLRYHPGVPAGESQWWHMASKLTDEGFETIEAMFDHAKHHREKVAA